MSLSTPQHWAGVKLPMLKRPAGRRAWPSMPGHQPEQGGGTKHSCPALCTGGTFQLLPCQPSLWLARPYTRQEILRDNYMLFEEWSHILSSEPHLQEPLRFSCIFHPVSSSPAKGTVPSEGRSQEQEEPAVSGEQETTALFVARRGQVLLLPTSSHVMEQRAPELAGSLGSSCREGPTGAPQSCSARQPSQQHLAAHSPAGRGARTRVFNSKVPLLPNWLAIISLNWTGLQVAAAFHGEQGFLTARGACALTGTHSEHGHRQGSNWGWAPRDPPTDAVSRSDLPVHPTRGLVHW